MFSPTCAHIEMALSLCHVVPLSNIHSWPFSLTHTLPLLRTRCLSPRCIACLYMIYHLSTLSLTYLHCLSLRSLSPPHNANMEVYTLYSLYIASHLAVLPVSTLSLTSLQCVYCLSPSCIASHLLVFIASQLLVFIASQLVILPTICNAPSQDCLSPL